MESEATTIVRVVSPVDRRRSFLEFSALSTVILAHDLQNLLSIMAGCVDSLVSRTHFSHADRDFAELNEAIDSGFRLSHELLGAVGLQQAAERLVIDVHELIGLYRGTLQRLVGEKVRFVVKSDTTPALVEATPWQVEWILLNLAANGRDAMPGGGVLRLETTRVEGGSTPGEPGIEGARFLRLTMRDEGGGMNDDIRASMFEPFFTTKARSAGLGLTSVAVTVAALAGLVYVETHESAGTSVHVILPLYPGKRQPPAARQRESSG